MRLAVEEQGVCSIGFSGHEGAGAGAESLHISQNFNGAHRRVLPAFFHDTAPILFSLKNFPGTYLFRGDRNLSVEGCRAYTTVQSMKQCRRAMLPDNHDGPEVGFQVDAALWGKATMSDRDKHFE